MWGNADGRTITVHRCGRGTISWGRPLSEVLGVAPDFASADPDLHFIHRRAGDADIYFVSNQSAREKVVNCTFRIVGKRAELWQADTGHCEIPAFAIAKDGVTTQALHFDPSGSIFVIFRGDLKVIAPVLWTAGPITRDGIVVSRVENGADPVVAVEETRTLFSRSEGETDGPLPAGPVDRLNQTIFTAWSDGAYHFTTAEGRTFDATVTGIGTPQRIDGGWTVIFPPNLGAPRRDRARSPGVMDGIHDSRR